MELGIAKDKSIDFEYPINDLIKKRRSGRAYSDRTIEPEKIRSLFEAARWAPSSMNEQPWMYIYATKEQDELWQKIFDSLMEGNQIWVKDAPLLIFSLVRKNFQRNGSPNYSAKYDMGGANALLSIQATEMGLNVHQMGGFDGKKIRENLNINEEYKLGVVMAIGYPGEIEMLPKELRQREVTPRVRNTQNAFVRNSVF